MSASSATGGPSLARSLAPIAVLTLVWGCNWLILKIGVTDLAPLTFRSLTLLFEAMGLLIVAYLSVDSIRISRVWGCRVAALACLHIAVWNGLVLFAVQHLPA